MTISSWNGDQAEKKLRDLMGKGRSVSKTTRIAAGLTCLQFSLALYATLLLYFMSPPVVLDHSPAADTPWVFHLASWRWQQLMLVQNISSKLPLSKRIVCQYNEQITSFDQMKLSNDTARFMQAKTELFHEILTHQHITSSRETLPQLLELHSHSSSSSIKFSPRVTVVLNHYNRKTLCMQLEALLHQTLPFYRVWVLAFASPIESSLRQIIQAYNDSRIHHMSSTYDYKLYGRWQLALQVENADYLYFLDDDMIPGRKMLQILVHVSGTEKYGGSLLGSIGGILPFRQKDFTFPSYRKSGSKEGGLYVPDPTYNIVVDRIMQVDFLSSSWFLSADLVKAIFHETPITFATGDDLHLSYQLQKYHGINSFVLPVDPQDKATWDHRLADVSETTVMHQDVLQIRDNQWWKAMSRGYVTQWATMHPQQSDVLFYAHSLGEVLDLAPLILRFRSVPGKKAFVVVSGGVHCPCEEAAIVLGWSPNSCHERRFKIFDLEIGLVHMTAGLRVPIFHQIAASIKGLIKIHSPALIITIADAMPDVRAALALSISGHNTSLVQLPRQSIEHALWMADVKTASLRNWGKMQVSVNVITQDRPRSLQRLLSSISTAYYLGDPIQLSFNLDREVDAQTLQIVNDFQWPHGKKLIRRRIVKGGLIRAVSESWYPNSNDDFGLLLEDDVEVSPFFYMWLKYSLLRYYYDPAGAIPELNAIALYTPKAIEVIKENSFKNLHPSIPYLHQLPCSWGTLFFPKHWREFYYYMGKKYSVNAESTNVGQIQNFRTNGRHASWNTFLTDLMYLRGYVTLYPNFPNQTSFSTNHMEPAAHINASNKVVKDFEVPLIHFKFWRLLPQKQLPPASKLPVINLLNEATTLKGLKIAGASLAQDLLPCKKDEIVIADVLTGQPLRCGTF